MAMKIAIGTPEIEEILSGIPVESREIDSVQRNFPPSENSSRNSRHLYLPPDEEQSFFVPEVIDNRVRFSSRPSLPIVPIVPPPEIDIRLPSRQFQNFVSHSPPQQQLTKNFNAGLTSSIFGFSSQSKEPDIQVDSMSCQNSGTKVFFRANLRLAINVGQPIVDSPVDEKNCRMERHNDQYRIDFNNELFVNCGIKDCSNDRDRYYCLNLRFPAIVGLRLKEDHKITLRCKTHDTTVSHTKQFNVKPLETSARNAVRVETGGYKNVFETEIGLYRKTFGSGHSFDAKIQPGGAVILGEEILLRALVREGDGWRYSRISDVTVHYVEKKSRSKIMNSLWILDANGCLNPDVREICSREQYRVSPLENYFMFEAFMFDNMKMSDEMVMSVKITGCIEGSDCTIDCPAGHSRRARRSLDENLQNETIDWSNDITFRVILPDSDELSSTVRSHKFLHPHLALPYIFSAFVLLTVLIILATIRVFMRQRISKLNEF